MQSSPIPMAIRIQAFKDVSMYIAYIIQDPPPLLVFAPYVIVEWPETVQNKGCTDVSKMVGGHGGDGEMEPHQTLAHHS